MKKLSFLFIPVIIILLSCGGNSKEKENMEDAMEAITGEKTSGGTIKDCDEFLDKYEEWIEEYIEFLGEYMKNPMNTVAAQKYAESAQKAAEWAQQWGFLYTCAADKKYAKRFEEISEIAEQRMEEMGLE